MATGRDYRRPCQDKEEKCVFCENLVSQKNMRRHLTSYCEIAKAECHGKDILKEADLKIFIACLFKGSQEQSFFLQTLLFTAFLVTVLKILTYALVST